MCQKRTWPSDEADVLRQRQIAAKIIQKKADYVLAVKENQPTLHEKVTALLDEAMLEKFAAMSHGHAQESCGGHGRIETRDVWVTDEVKWLGKQLPGQWQALSSIAVVESTRNVAGKVSAERRYYISSRRGTDAAAMPRRSAITGGGWRRTGCTGNWTCPSTKIRAACARTMGRKICRVCVDWR